MSWDFPGGTIFLVGRLFGSISRNLEVGFFHTKAFRRLWENRLGILGCSEVSAEVWPMQKSHPSEIPDFSL